MIAFSVTYKKTDSNKRVQIGDIVTNDFTFEKVLVTQIISIDVGKDYVTVLGVGMKYIEPCDEL